MRRNVLSVERDAARRAIEATEVSRCWSWEQYATAGSYPPMDRCLDEVRRSDALVMILGRDVTISGDFNGKVTQPDGDVVHIKINDVQVTADVTVEQAEEGCTIGYITLEGKLTVALLGLHLVIDQLNVQLEGFPDEGILGTLLCGLAGAGSTSPTSPT
jgi:hypothetical protein